jgi:predicted transcriptional regulator
MLVKQLMTANVSSCRQDNNLAEIAEIMWNNRCGALPILDSSGCLAPRVGLEPMYFQLTGDAHPQ